MVRLPLEDISWDRLSAMVEIGNCGGGRKEHSENYRGIN